jgi:hypothetical protein
MVVAMVVAVPMMVMAVIMTMGMVVSVVMIVAVGVLVPGVVVVIMKAMVMSGIGSAFGREGGNNVGDRRAQSDQHVADDMIAADAEAVLKDFCGEMTVAELPGQGGEMADIAPAHLVKRFRFGMDLDDAAIIKQDALAVAEQSSFRQVEQEGDAVVGPERDAAAVPPRLVQGDGVGGSGEVADYAGGADHHVSRSEQEVTLRHGQHGCRLAG